jgi:hypothetical protein
MADILRHRRTGEKGQASVEVIATIPVLILSGIVGLQLLVTGYAWTLADGAVEAGALAIAADRPPTPAVRAALPGWARDRVDVEVDGGRVSLTLRPPSPVPVLGEALAIRSTAWARPPGSA